MFWSIVRPDPQRPAEARRKSLGKDEADTTYSEEKLIFPFNFWVSHIVKNNATTLYFTITFLGQFLKRALEITN